MISPGLPGIKHDIHLHVLVRNQDSGLTMYLQVCTILILTLDTKKNNNIDPMLDPITLNIQRKLEEIVEQKTDPNWTLNVETMIFENLPSGT